jgi:two-component system chemotaxis sensor kinase CheA
LSQADDFGKFKQSFCEEGREILVDLESALLELNERCEDGELVSRVFRALHTLKGSGAMFGFEDLAAFTHDLETAFDAVRNGRLKISGELVDLTLASLDQIRSMLEPNAEAESAVVVERNRLLAAVRQLAGIDGNENKEGEFVPVEERPPLESGERREWCIQFVPGPDLLLNGANPLLLIEELRQLGGLSVRANLAGVPPLDVLEPERCYVSWEMVLSTSASANAIRDVFIFVEDGCELTVEPLAAASAELPRGADQTEAPARQSPRGEQRAGAGPRKPDDAARQTSSLRVPAAKLDQFVDLVGELVTVQARLSELAARRDDPEVTEVAEEVERLAAALRENSMNIRMVPIRATFEKFRRLVHDLARDLGKSVDLTIEGADTELDKTVIEKLGDPLMHLIRNSMDHGIEPSSVRAAYGKQGRATLHLAARHAGASVLIEVADDGCGIDAEAVKARAIEKGLMSADAHLTGPEAIALIFQPGFSTAKNITGVSGRGVGMDVVRKSVESLRGTIDVASKRGEGTTVTLRLPLTLAIIDGLLVRVATATFVLPLANTVECIELSREQIAQANGKHVVEVRGEVIPYIRLREYFNLRAERVDLEQIMVVETEGGRYGFVVDEVLGDCQTVIKSLSRVYRHVQAISGATILGNGSVALILNPERLALEAVRSAETSARSQVISKPRYGHKSAAANTTPSRKRAGGKSGAGEKNNGPA